MRTDTTHYVPPLCVIYHKKAVYKLNYTGMFYSEFISDNISNLYSAFTTNIYLAIPTILYFVIPTNRTWFSVQGRQDLQLRGLEQRRGQSQTALLAPFESAANVDMMLFIMDPMQCIAMEDFFSIADPIG